MWNLRQLIPHARILGLQLAAGGVAVVESGYSCLSPPSEILWAKDEADGMSGQSEITLSLTHAVVTPR